MVVQEPAALALMISQAVRAVQANSSTYKLHRLVPPSQTCALLDRLGLHGADPAYAAGLCGGGCAVAVYCAVLCCAVLSIVNRVQTLVATPHGISGPKHPGGWLQACRSGPSEEAWLLHCPAWMYNDIMLIIRE
jgi:hypothetical protein